MVRDQVTKPRSVPPFGGPVTLDRVARALGVVVWNAHTATRSGVGWRGRIRTFDLLIQSQVTDFRHSSLVVSTKCPDFCPKFYRVW